jgi:hypothetical protein
LIDRLRSNGLLSESMRRLTGTLALSAGALTLMLTPGCEPDECAEGQSRSGLLGDTPRPTLCASDRTAFTPSRATLTSRREQGAVFDATGSGGASAVETGDGGGASEETTGGAVEELPMALVAESADGSPRDTVSVRIQVCGPQALVDLKPALGAEGHCQNLTTTQLQCSTSANGIARFVAVHGNRGGGTTQLCAVSGGRTSATAIITVGDVVVDDLALRVEPEELGFGPDAELACSDDAQDCGGLGTRSASIRVAILDANGVESPVSTSQEVQLTIRDLSGRTDAVGLGSRDCSSPLAARSTMVAANGSTSDPLLLCLDARRAAFELTAQIGGKIQSKRFAFDAVPRRVRLSSTTDGMGAAGAPGVESQRLELLDCDGKPLQNRVFVWQVGAQPTQTAVTDALGGFMLPALEGILTVGVTEGATEGALISCRTPLGGG